MPFPVLDNKFQPYSKDKILNELENVNGFYLAGAIGSEDLDQLWLCVLEGFRQCFGLEKIPGKEVMKNVHLYPELQSQFSSLSVFDRTLSSDLAFKILESEWLNDLVNVLEYYPVDTHGFGYPSFVWRLMRPGQSGDLRGLHRDAWFRFAIDEPHEIDSGASAQLQTIKVWLALNVEPGASGLLVSPGSQLDLRPGFSITEKDGLIKPVVNISEVDDTKFIHALTQNGSMVLFGEQLMHGGAPTNSKSSRISLEFTLARSSQSYYQTFIGSNHVKTKVNYITKAPK